MFFLTEICYLFGYKFEIRDKTFDCSFVFHQIKIVFDVVAEEN